MKKRKGIRECCGCGDGYEIKVDGSNKYCPDCENTLSLLNPPKKLLSASLLELLKSLPLHSTITINQLDNLMVEDGKGKYYGYIDMKKGKVMKWTGW